LELRAAIAESEAKKADSDAKKAESDAKKKIAELEIARINAGVSKSSLSSSGRNSMHDSHGALGVDAQFVESMQYFLTEHYMLFACRADANGDIKIKIEPKNANVMELTQPCIMEWSRYLASQSRAQLAKQWFSNLNQ
jgi:hypothetical protein